MQELLHPCDAHGKRAFLIIVPFVMVSILAVRWLGIDEGGKNKLDM